MPIEKRLTPFTGLVYLVFYRGDSSLECFNREIQNNRLCQSVPVRCRTRDNIFLSLLSLIGKENEGRGMHVARCFQW